MEAVAVAMAAMQVTLAEALHPAVVLVSMQLGA